MVLRQRSTPDSWPCAPQAALAPLGTLQDALTLQPGPSLGAVWPVSPGAQRWGSAQALGPTRAGTLAWWPVSARGSAPGARLSAVRLALSPAAWAGRGCGPVEAAARDAQLDGRAQAHARRAARLVAPRPTTQPASLLAADGPRRFVAGTPHALAALGDQRDGKTGQRQLVLG
jgi:hypothetical protein